MPPVQAMPISDRREKQSPVFQISHTAAHHLFFITYLPIVIEDKSYTLQVVRDITGGSYVDLGQNGSYELTDLFKNENYVILKNAFTDIHNELTFHEQVPQEIDLSLQANRKLTLFTFYLGNLNLMNDVYGREAGDQVIKEFMRILRYYAHRKNGWAGRNSGLKFTLVLFDLDDKSIHQICRHIHEKFNHLELLTNYKEIAIDLQIGFQSMQNEIMTASQLAQAAVKNRLYFHESDQATAGVPFKAVLSAYLFTQTEETIALMIMQGYSNLAIAQNLSISVPTVKKHASMIYRKLQVKNRVEMISKFRT